MRIALLFSLITAAPVATAQSFVFRDDFNGTALDPAWSVNLGGTEGTATMTYNVGSGFLRPTGWIQGTNPQFTGGAAGFVRQMLPNGQYIGEFGTPFSARMRARVPQAPFQSLGLGVGATDQFNITLPDSSFMQIGSLSANLFRVRLEQNSDFSQAQINLTPGLFYDFEMRVQNGQLEALVDGVVVASRPWIPSFVNNVGVGMTGDVGIGQGPDVDHVEVVPEPAFAVVFGAAGAALLARRKRSSARKPTY